MLKLVVQLEAWARDGLTEEQIAHNMGIAYSTLKYWKNDHLAILAALKRGKDVVDIQVENAITQEKSRLLRNVRVNMT